MSDSLEPAYLSYLILFLRGVPSLLAAITLILAYREHLRFSSSNTPRALPFPPRRPSYRDRIPEVQDANWPPASPITRNYVKERGDRIPFVTPPPFAIGKRLDALRYDNVTSRGRGRDQTHFRIVYPIPQPFDNINSDGYGISSGRHGYESDRQYGIRETRSGYLSIPRRSGDPSPHREPVGGSSSPDGWYEYSGHRGGGLAPEYGALLARNAGRRTQNEDQGGERAYFPWYADGTRYDEEKEAEAEAEALGEEEEKEERRDQQECCRGA
ncbi:hypothetical protein BU26DRAFT_567685 [Trematosphaeria pertusa]|uniref:Uncharacterized protein n=1 Tax=Trematosphaeria pertusa TaxID=390896 RepID=A0A6A6I9J8_9PLEO|nr:uncharacterized protein BU26DRAFT_567685 [Trematosphaeria pertusa]KAF2246190.1 hypothetical protein BU26DRAFT_567685 [Trematosphaeria pertusa]